MLTWIGGSALAIVIGAAWILRRQLQRRLQAEADADRARLQRMHHDAAQRSLAAADYGKFTRRRTDQDDEKNVLGSRGRTSRLSGRQDLRGPRHGR